MAIRYRGAEPTDLPYIIKGWLLNARHTERHDFLTQRDYDIFYRQRIIRHLSQCFVRIAYDDSEPDLIAGWIAYSIGPNGELVIHYVYVRQMLWNMKIATGLIADIEPDYMTKPIVSTVLFVFHDKLLRKHHNFFYNPYILE